MGKYLPEQDRWVSLHIMPYTRRLFFGGVELNGLIYLVGGRDNNASLRNTDIFVP